MRTLSRSAAAGALLLTASAVAGAEDSVVQVIGLRADPVALYDCEDGTKKREFARREFRDPWPVLPVGSEGLLGSRLEVMVEGTRYCVNASTVRTNRPRQPPGPKGPINPRDRGGAGTPG